MNLVDFSCMTFFAQNIQVPPNHILLSIYELLWNKVTPNIAVGLPSILLNFLSLKKHFLGGRGGGWCWSSTAKLYLHPLLMNLK